MTARQVVLRPVVTEKSMEGVAQGRYTFVVALSANKVEIRKAVEEIWQVRVRAVNTMRVHGKKRRLSRNAAFGHRPDWKKAIVTLRAGEKIPFFEGLA